MTKARRVVILYNDTRPDAPADQRDVLVQRDAVERALQRLGHTTHPVPCDLDLASIRRKLEKIRPDLVFNLVESLAETDRLMCVIPLLLDAMLLPYTGSDSEAIFLTGDKILAKRWLRTGQLPTPDAWRGDDPLGRSSELASRHRTETDRQWIIKPIAEHASRGIDDASVLRTAEEEELAQRIREREQETGCPHFAEVYVEGREFNLSLLAIDASQMEVLPPAEIEFRTFPTNRPRIVGYQAKWDEQSVEYQQTPRRFDFPPSDWPMLNRLRELSQQCWNRFGLRGYARVDFRVDADGVPWILEINTNPCLSPDAGFAAAVQTAGFSYEQAIARILNAVPV